MPQTNDKIIRFLVKGNTANVVLATPLDNIIDDVLDAKTLSDHLKADKPLTLTPSASGTYLVLSIDDKALCYVVEYNKTTYADFIANKGKPIAIKDDNLIAPVSTYFEEYYVKMYAYVDKDIYIYQLNINNEWSRTKLDNASVVKAQPHLTTFNEIKNSDYAYLEGTENWIYSLSEKTDEKIAFVNIDNDMRHIWSVTKDDIWTLTDEHLCNNKQDKLTAGDNITIENNVISAKGGDAWTYESSSLTANAVFKQYIDQTLTGWIGTVAINVEKDADIGIIRIKNNIDTPIHVSLYNMVTYTLFGVGNKTAYGYVLDIPGNGMLVAKIDHKALYTTLSKYSSGSSTPTETQNYDVDGNPIDAMLALSTSLFAKLDIGHCIEVVDQMIANLKTTFGSMLDKGLNSEQSEVLPKLNTFFSAAYTA